MSTTIIRPSSREEWLEYRKTGIGSSEVATIVGLNPFETPLQLWRRKKGIDAPKEENFAMKAGHYLEDAVSKFWQDETGLQVIKRSAIDWIIRDNERPYLQVSPDRTYWLSESRRPSDKGILEIKTTQKAIDETDLPKHWMCQVQYQLGVAGCEYGSLAWLTCGRSFGYVDIALNPSFFGWLVDEVDKFWHDCIDGDQEPAAVNAADVALKYGVHVEGKEAQATDDLFKDYLSLLEVRKEIDALDERKEALEDKLKMAFGDAESLSYHGETLATWKAPKASQKFDAKAFQKDHPDLAKEYTAPYQGSRRFLLK